MQAVQERRVGLVRNQLPTQNKFAIDFMSRLIHRWGGRKGAGGFQETVYDHNVSLRKLVLNDIMPRFTNLCKEIDMIKVLNMLDPHDLPEIADGDEPRSSPNHGINRKARHKREQKTFRSKIIYLYPEELRKNASAFYYRFEHPRSTNKEALFAHVLDQAQANITALNHYSNPNWLHNGKDQETIEVFKNSIKEMLGYVNKLSSRLSNPANRELSIFVSEIGNEFLYAGYTEFEELFQDCLEGIKKCYNPLV